MKEMENILLFHWKGYQFSYDQLKTLIVLWDFFYLKGAFSVLQLHFNFVEFYVKMLSFLWWQFWSFLTANFFSNYIVAVV